MLLQLVVLTIALRYGVESGKTMIWLQLGINMLYSSAGIECGLNLPKPTRPIWACIWQSNSICQFYFLFESLAANLILGESIFRYFFTCGKWQPSSIVQQKPIARKTLGNRMTVYNYPVQWSIQNFYHRCMSVIIILVYYFATTLPIWK